MGQLHEELEWKNTLKIEGVNLLNYQVAKGPRNVGGNFYN